MTGGNDIFVGRVGGLAGYPVKSMAGEAVARASITATGLEGDRVFAAIDQATGKIASAKRPHLWRGLLACSARLVADGVQITLSSGERGLAGAPAMDQTLCERLRRPVRLAGKVPAQPELDRAHPGEVLAEGDDADVESDPLAMGAGAPAGTFFDFAAIHLLTTDDAGQPLSRPARRQAGARALPPQRPRPLPARRRRLPQERLPRERLPRERLPRERLARRHAPHRERGDDAGHPHQPPLRHPHARPRQPPIPPRRAARRIWQDKTSIVLCPKWTKTAWCGAVAMTTRRAGEWGALARRPPGRRAEI